MLIPHKPSRFLHTVNGPRTDLDDVTVIEMPDLAHAVRAASAGGRVARINARPPSEEPVRPDDDN